MRTLGAFVEWLCQNDAKPQTVIDVGVCYGTPELQNGLPQAHHILIEPLPDLRERLETLREKLGAEYFSVALGSEERCVRMKVEPRQPESATCAITEPISDGDPRLRIVRMVRLDSLLNDRVLQRPILLKTDCQGWDLEVLKGAGAWLREIDVVVMEANLFRPAGDPRLADFGVITKWMVDHGFAVFDILSYQTRPRDRALGYVDLAFVREDGPLRSSHSWV